MLLLVLFLNQHWSRWLKPLAALLLEVAVLQAKLTNQAVATSKQLDSLVSATLARCVHVFTSYLYDWQQWCRNIRCGAVVCCCSTLET
jgi:hypothetical protein